MLGDTGDAGGVSMAAGKSLPLVRVALSLVASVEAAGLPAAPEAAAGGLRADSAVWVLQSRVGGLADDGALAASALVVGFGLLLLLTLLLLAARPGAAPRTMSDNLLLTVVAEVVAVVAEEPSSAVAPWLNDSSSWRDKGTARRSLPREAVQVYTTPELFFSFLARPTECCMVLTSSV